MSCCAAQIDLSICKGIDFDLPLRYEVLPLVYKPITAIANSAPVRITCPAHGIPIDWRVAVVSSKGVTQLNSLSVPPKKKDFRVATVVDADTIEFNPVITVDDPVHVAGTGYLVYYTPVDLAAFNYARMQIKDSVGGTEHALLTTSNGGITLDNVDKKVRLHIPASITEAFNITEGVYDLELVTPTGGVYPFISGAVTICDEVTTVA